MTVEIMFASKAPHKTRWLEMWFPVGDEPTELLVALAKIGWRNDGVQAPPLDGVQHIFLSPPQGSSLFGGWLPRDGQKFMSQVRAVLRHHGFPKVPWRKKTLEELV